MAASPFLGGGVAGEKEATSAPTEDGGALLTQLLNKPRARPQSELDRLMGMPKAPAPSRPSRFSFDDFENLESYQLQHQRELEYRRRHQEPPPRALRLCPICGGRDPGCPGRPGARGWGY